MYKLIAIVGKSGAGKDRLLREIINYEQESFTSNLHRVVTSTTRPPREGEIDGVDYHFLTEEKYFDKPKIESVLFKTWLYGTSEEDLCEDKINIGIFNPRAVLLLQNEPKVELSIIEVAAAPKTRLIRQLSRTTNPDIDEIYRRYKADETDSALLPQNHIVLRNENEDDLIINIKFILELSRSWANQIN